MRPRGLQQWLSIGIALALAVAVVVVIVLHHTSDRTFEPRWQPDTMVGDGGRSIELTYTGTACDKGARVTVDESSTEVTLTIHVTESKGNCIGVGIRRTITAHLRAPLGQRKLVDGAP